VEWFNGVFPGFCFSLFFFSLISQCAFFSPRDCATYGRRIVASSLASNIVWHIVAYSATLSTWESGGDGLSVCPLLCPMSGLPRIKVSAGSGLDRARCRRLDGLAALVVAVPDVPAWTRFGTSQVVGVHTTSLYMHCLPHAMPPAIKCVCVS
jgi:hypothetical protein